MKDRVYPFVDSYNGLLNEVAKQLTQLGAKTGNFNEEHNAYILQSEVAQFFQKNLESRQFKLPGPLFAISAGFLLCGDKGVGEPIYKNVEAVETNSVMPSYLMSLDLAVCEVLDLLQNYVFDKSTGTYLGHLYRIGPQKIKVLEGATEKEHEADGCVIVTTTDTEDIAEAGGLEQYADEMPQNQEQGTRIEWEEHTVSRGAEDKPICKIENGPNAWTLTADTNTIAFTGRHNAEWLADKFAELGYKIEMITEQKEGQQ